MNIFFFKMVLEINLPEVNPHPPTHTLFELNEREMERGYVIRKKKKMGKEKKS